MQSKSQNELVGKKIITTKITNKSGGNSLSTKTKITEIIKTCSNELTPYFLNTLTLINESKKHPHMFERKINPKLDSILNRNKDKFMVACERELA